VDERERDRHSTKAVPVLFADRRENHGKNYCHYAIFGVLLKKVIYYKEEEHV